MQRCYRVNQRCFLQLLDFNTFVNGMCHAKLPRSQDDTGHIRLTGHKAGIRPRRKNRKRDFGICHAALMPQFLFSAQRCFCALYQWILRISREWQMRHIVHAFKDITDDSVKPRIFFLQAPREFFQLLVNLRDTFLRHASAIQLHHILPAQCLAGHRP